VNRGRPQQKSGEKCVIDIVTDWIMSTIAMTILVMRSPIPFLDSFAWRIAAFLRGGSVNASGFPVSK
jgi:hypothetical protein